MTALLLHLHIVAGLLSITLFWLPALAKKGGKLHVESGKIYIFSMWIVVLTAAMLCLIRLTQGAYEIALFLGFLSLITANPLWHGIAVLRKPSQKFWSVKTLFDFSILVAGIGMIALGFLWWGNEASILMFIFGSLGLTNYFDLRRSLSKVHRGNRVQSHLTEMIVSAIAGYTAFFAFGARQFLDTLLTGQWQILPWILPTILGVLIIQLIRPKFGKKAHGGPLPSTQSA